MLSKRRVRISMIKGHCVKQFDVLGQDMATHFEINCFNVLGPTCIGAAIFEINKR